MSPGTACLATAITGSGIWAIRAALVARGRPRDWTADRAHRTGPRTTARKENRT